jgi:hypothetical protein
MNRAFGVHPLGCAVRGDTLKRGHQTALTDPGEQFVALVAHGIRPRSRVNQPEKGRLICERD